jgi:hypothetical protein
MDLMEIYRMLRTLRVFIVFTLLLVGSVFVVQPTSAQGSRQVWAYYFGWYTGESWNDGRLIDRPAEPYYSADGGVVSRQVDQAMSAGIDAFIMSWFGPRDNNLTHQTFNILLDVASSRGFRAAASVDMQEAGYNATTGDVLDSLRYLIGDRVNHPAYLRYDGKPVIYFWNQSRFSIAEWTDIRNQIDPNRNTIWVMEGTNTNYLSVFDGLYLFNTAWGNSATVSNTWMSRTYNAGGTFYSPTVMPGWDESRIEGRTNPTDPQDRSAGRFLSASWNGAISSGANVMLIVSWNEYLENSHIEPSQNLGWQALDTLRPLISAWKGGGGAVASTAAGAPEGAPTGLTFDPDYNLRLRSAPNTESDVIDTIPYNVVVQVVGRTADNSWVQVNYNGASGWAAAWLGVISGDLNAVPVTG